MGHWGLGSQLLDKFMCMHNEKEIRKVLSSPLQVLLQRIRLTAAKLPQAPQNWKQGLFISPNIDQGSYTNLRLAALVCNCENNNSMKILVCGITSSLFCSQMGCPKLSWWTFSSEQHPAQKLCCAGKIPWHQPLHIRILVYFRRSYMYLMLLSKTSKTCVLLQPKGARAKRPTLSLFWKPSAEFLQLVHTHKPISLQRAPQLQIDSQLEVLLTSVCVGARLYWRGPSDVALSDSKWQKRKEEEDKGRKKGKRQGRKRECLDNLTKQICRHHVLFFNTFS